MSRRLLQLRSPRGAERRPAWMRDGQGNRRASLLRARGRIEIHYLDFEPALLQFPGMPLPKTDGGLVDAPIVKRKLSDHVLDRLKAMITSGEYAPGSPLPSERELMVRYGVGRPAIREAMQALANQGLITIKHGERARVRPLSAKAAVGQLDLVAQLMLSASPGMLENLKEARRFFERGMVREAALKADAADIEQLERLVEQQQAAIERPDDFATLDRAFHGKLAAISRNAIFDAVAEAMLGWLPANPDEPAGRRRELAAEYAEIVARLKARDPDGAEAALLRSLDLAEG
jgi:DNA-binding FadR family transcriptional regulator